MDIHLLQTLQNPDRTVEVIKAIGSTWPFLLSLFFVLFIILKWKAIGVFLSGLNKVSGKTPIGEFNFEKKIDETPNEEKILINSEPPNINNTETEQIEKKDPDFYDVYLALRDQKTSEANALFEKMQLATPDPIKKEQNELYFLLHKYFTGNNDSLKELENKIPKLHNKRSLYLAYRFSGDCYKQAKNYQMALLKYKESYKCSETDTDRVDVANEISLVHYSNSDKEAAFNYLKYVKEELQDSLSKSRIFKSLANLYDKEKKWLLKSIALEMALSLNPNDTSLIFDVAYAYADSYDSRTQGLTKLSMLHYEELVRLNGKSEYGYNNLGVAYSRLNLPNRAMRNYKKSLDLGNSLAAANIATKYIQQGFFEEAKEILNKIKNNENIHENVWTSLNDIAKKEKDEQEKVELYQNNAQREQLFIRKMAERLFDKNEILLNFDGIWKCYNETVELNTFQNLIILKTNYDINTYAINFEIPKSFSLIGRGTAYPIQGGTSLSLEVLGIVNSDVTTISLLAFDIENNKSIFFDIHKT